MKAIYNFPGVVEFTLGSEQPIRVALNQPFTMKLIDAGEELRWATIGDAITRLQERPDGLSADVVATAIGKGEIQLQGIDRGIRYWVELEVYDKAAEATRLDVGAGVKEPLANG